MNLNPSNWGESVDAKAIAKILLIADRAFVVEMIDTYLVDAEIFMAQMQTAFDRDDLAILHHASHSLKSISASMGAEKLSNICKELESNARHKMQLLDRDQLLQIQSEYKNVCQDLGFYRSQYDNDLHS
jgi:HPt (histidine-containing phosphotransfer) domain-containing protein